ncbi:MAG TPA: hypothetical protein VE689_11710, partial [Candidatus Udaeobacter sp.]|nr:hypothetical protein [Candidatus Udaeobacter sp.]
MRKLLIGAARQTDTLGFNILINQERLKNLLIELIKIDSLSRREYDIAMRLKREMEELGATVWIDDAGEKVGGNVGNLIANFSGNAPSARPLLL